VRDRLFGDPDGVGEEAVVGQGRKIRVADGEPWCGRRIADDEDLEVLFQKTAGPTPVTRFIALARC
jgi:hypothetical protein